jgi:hypothetical protein
VDSKLPSFSARFTNCISAELALLNITTRVHASTSRLFVSRRTSLLKRPLRDVERRIFSPYFCKHSLSVYLVGLAPRVDYESPIAAPNTLVL